MTSKTDEIISHIIHRALSGGASSDGTEHGNDDGRLYFASDWYLYILLFLCYLSHIPSFTTFEKATVNLGCM